MKHLTIAVLIALTAFAVGTAPARASRIVVVWNNTAHCAAGQIADVQATHPMNYRNPETAHALTAEISGSKGTFTIKYF